jgi:hypothetical protein
MKKALEGLFLLYESAVGRSLDELKQKYSVKGRVYGPISDMIIALDGLEELSKNSVWAKQTIGSVRDTFKLLEKDISNGRYDVNTISGAVDIASVFSNHEKKMNALEIRMFKLYEK